MAVVLGVEGFGWAWLFMIMKCECRTGSGVSCTIVDWMGGTSYVYGTKNPDFLSQLQSKANYAWFRLISTDDGPKCDMNPMSQSRSTPQVSTPQVYHVGSGISLSS